MKVGKKDKKVLLATMTKNTAHSSSVSKLLDTYQVNSDKGLSGAEAKKRLKSKGPNRLTEEKKKSPLQLFLEQFKSTIIYLLLGAAVISWAMGEIPEAIAISVVILLNTIIGFFMEYQAQNSMELLKEMDKLMVSVVRDGQRKEMDAENLVPGDIIFVEEGNLIPADCRVLEQNELKVNESALTGESFPVNKQTDALAEDVPLADRTNMVFKGTSVNMGNGKCLVVATGMETGIGDIAQMVSEEDKDKIPLNRKLNKLSSQLIWIVLGLAGAYAVTGYFTGQQVLLVLQTAIAWAIAAIPEGLAIVATIALAAAMQRLARENIIVKRLAAVETLGETTTILTDKTGTLTENQLTVEQLQTAEKPRKAGEFNWKEHAGEDRFSTLIQVAALCNNAHTDHENRSQGDTVEVSLMHYINTLESGLFDSINGDFERLDEDPFDSESKFMATVHKSDQGRFYAMKGAAEQVLDRCTHVLTFEGVKELKDSEREQWQERDNTLSADGLKTLAFAYKQSNEEQPLEKAYVFIGLIGFLDPPRPEIKDAIATCRQAGIRVIMVTGDHPETSRNIARQVGIIDNGEPNVVTGRDLEERPKGARSTLHETSVFARVDPRQKLDILNVFKDAGDITGMTGDGMNDAPALKRADIGIAMGKRGSQVAQQYADMVLKEDDFTSIITAIRQGRIIFTNIRKFVEYQLSYHLSEILVIAAISFSVFTLPILPLQLLFLNLLVDVFPALALSLSQGLPGVMKQPPKDPKAPILTRESWKKITAYGTIMAVWVIGAYFFGLFYLDLSKDIINNITFFSLAFTQLLHVFNMREANEHPFLNQVTRNKYVWQAIALCAVVLLGAYFIPGLNTLLSFQPMGLAPWLVVGTTIIGAITSIQVLKYFKRIK